MGRDRAHISLDDDQIDLEELTSSVQKPRSTAKQQKMVAQAAAETGFTSRQPKKMGRRRTSPYTAQFGGKCREGMKPLFQKIGERLDYQDTVTLELAILALIEKEGLEDLKTEYDGIVN